jgi:hypothetical protein
MDLSFSYCDDTPFKQIPLLKKIENFGSYIAF